jgi:hypothetical protein
VSKYSTEKIADILWAAFKAHGLEEEELDAIIAKLQAADALASTAKLIIGTTTPEKFDRDYEAFIKAIKEYEEA